MSPIYCRIVIKLTGPAAKRLATGLAVGAASVGAGTGGAIFKNSDAFLECVKKEIKTIDPQINAKNTTPGSLVVHLEAETKEAYDKLLKSYVNGELLAIINKAVQEYAEKYDDPQPVYDEIEIIYPRAAESVDENAVQLPPANSQSISITNANFGEVYDHQGSIQNVFGDVNIHVIQPEVQADSLSGHGHSANVTLKEISDLLQQIFMVINPMGLKYDEETFPRDIHPQLANIDNFYEGQLAKNKEYHPTSRQTNRDFARLRKVSFEQLKEIMYSGKYSILVGGPGSGKTTLSKKLAQSDTKLVMHHRCLEIPNEEKLTLKQLIVDNAYPHLDEEASDKVFKWIKRNPSKCVFIFDGYDQATWSLDNVKPINAAVHTRLSVEQIIANLCGKKFLRGASIALTSRPHSVIFLQEELRPENLFYLMDFEFVDMRKIFFAFAGGEAQRIWDTFNRQAPMLLDLCLIPIMLQLTLLAALGADDVTELRSTTQVFRVLLKNLRHSEYARAGDIESMYSALGELAYNATKNSTVIMTHKQIKEKGLSDKDVQDLIISVPGLERFNQKIFEGEQKLIFQHQTLQEYLCSLYISQNMSLYEFSQIVKKLVSDPHWAMVRRFGCGLLLGSDFTVPEPSIQAKQQSTDQQVANQQPSTSATQPSLSDVDQTLTDTSQNQQNKIKAEMFYEHFLEEFKQNPENFGMIVDLQECTEAVLQSFAKNFPVKADFRDQTIGTSACHALGRMLQHVNKPIESLDLSDCNLTSQGWEHICKGIGEMPYKIKLLNLSTNYIGNEGALELSHVLPNIEELYLMSCNLTSLGVKHICKEIGKMSHKIERLVLIHNHIGDEGALELSRVLPNIEQLWVGGCGITEEGKEVIRMKLRELGIDESRVDFTQPESWTSRLSGATKKLPTTSSVKLYLQEIVTVPPQELTVAHLTRTKNEADNNESDNDSENSSPNSSQHSTTTGTHHPLNADDPQPKSGTSSAQADATKEQPFTSQANDNESGKDSNKISSVNSEHSTTTETHHPSIDNNDLSGENANEALPSSSENPSTMDGSSVDDHESNNGSEKSLSVNSEHSTTPGTQLHPLNADDPQPKSGTSSAQADATKEQPFTSQANDNESGKDSNKISSVNSEHSTTTETHHPADNNESDNDSENSSSNSSQHSTTTGTHHPSTDDVCDENTNESSPSSSSENPPTMDGSSKLNADDPEPKSGTSSTQSDATKEQPFTSQANDNESGKDSNKISSVNSEHSTPTETYHPADNNESDNDSENSSPNSSQHSTTTGTHHPSTDDVCDENANDSSPSSSSENPPTIGGSSKSNADDPQPKSGTSSTQSDATMERPSTSQMGNKRSGKDSNKILSVNNKHSTTTKTRHPKAQPPVNDADNYQIVQIISEQLQKNHEELRKLISIALDKLNIGKSSTTQSDAFVEQPSTTQHNEDEFKNRYLPKKEPFYDDQSLVKVHTIFMKRGETKQPLCAKIINKNICESPNEEKLLLSLKDSHVVHYYGLWSMDFNQSYAFVMELCCTTVEDYLKKPQNWIDIENGEKVINGTDIRDALPISHLKILKQSTLGLQYLHSENIIHRDIKPSNFFVTKKAGKAIVKIGDFGISRKRRNKVKSSAKISVYGTEMYMPPEAFEIDDDDNCLEKNFTLSYDIFSFGIMWYFVLTNGNHPFGGMNGHRYNVTDRNKPTLKPQDMDCKISLEKKKEALELIGEMLQFEPTERCDIGVVSSHSFFDGCS